MPLHFRPTRSGISLAVRYSPGKALPNGIAFVRNLEASYHTQAGLVVFAAPNVPRDSHYIAGVRTLLLEPASTNIVPFSSPAYVGAGGWQAFLALNQGAVPGADGVVGTGAQIHCNTVTDGSAWYETFGFALGSWWHSSYAKNGVDGPRYFRHSQSSAAVAVYGVDHLTTANWLRYGTKIVNADAANVNVGWRGAVTGGNNLSRQFYGYQVEDGALPAFTSYIRTNGAAVTRPVDDFRLNKSGTLYEQYYDDAGALQESVRAYVANTIVIGNRPRGYIALKLALGTYSLGQMRNA